MMSRIQGQPQSGYTQLLEGSFLTTARAVNLDVHHKHCYQIAKFLRGKTTIQAIEYLEKVINRLNGTFSPQEFSYLVAVFVVNVQIYCPCCCEEGTLQQLSVSALRLSLYPAHHFHLTSMPRVWKSVLPQHLGQCA